MKLFEIERMRSKNQLTFTLSILLAFFAFSPAYSLTQANCVENGGNYLCSAPTVSDWGYRLCDEMAPYLSRYKAWCYARGGTPPDAFSCVGSSPDAESNLVSRSIEFARRIDGNADCGVISDSGWGHTSTSYQCLSGTPTIQNGFLTRDFRQIQVGPGCGETIYAVKSRSLICPTGSTKTNIGSSIVCLKEHHFSECGIGNPILPLTGRKLQKELDFQHPSFSFYRIYSSDAWFIPYNISTILPSFTGLFGNFWRTNFDYRLFHLTNELAPYAISLPSGAIQYFDADLSPILIGGEAGVLTQSVGGFRYEQAGLTLAFSSKGRLTQYQSNNNKKLIFNYSGENLSPPVMAILPDGRITSTPIPEGLLVSIEDETQSEIYRFSYDAGARLITATFGADEILYGYDELDNLTFAKRSDGSIRKYLYENSSFKHALTGIINETGRVFAQWEYDALGRAISSRHDNYEHVTLDFSFTGSESKVDTVNSFGKKMSFYYSVIKGQRQIIT